MQHRSSSFCVYHARNINNIYYHKLSATNGDGADNIDDTQKKSWFFPLVLPLLLVYISNQWSRSSIYYLVDFSSNDPTRAINVAIGFSEAQYGLLASLAFTALFAVASLGAGIASDRYDRKLLTMIASSGWAIATLGTAWSTTYPQVLGWRIAMGLFCAFSTPTAYTLINENVPTEQKSLATSIYGTGVAFGGALASLSILLNNQWGWQQALNIIGVVGFVSAALVFVLLPADDSNKAYTRQSTYNPPENMTAKEGSMSKTSWIVDFTEALSTGRARWIFLGSFFRFSSGLCIGVWSAPFFRMMFPDSAANYALAQAFITAVAGSASGVIGGTIADYLSSRSSSDDDPNGVRLWVPVVGCLLAAPTFYLATHTVDSFQGAMIWLTVEYLVAECWFGPTISTLLSTVPSKIGGTAQGMFTLTGGIANLAPTALGYFYGQASAEASLSSSSSSSELQNLLSTVVCLCYLLSALCFVLGAQQSQNRQD